MRYARKREEKLEKMQILEGENGRKWEILSKKIKNGTKKFPTLQKRGDEDLEVSFLYRLYPLNHRALWVREVRRGAL